MGNDTDTQDVDLQASTPEEQVTPDTSTENDEYFLTVDDRTRYKTVEDAQKAYREAGQRIGQLSGWEKEIGQVYGIDDPRQVREWLEDYRKLREAAEAQANAPKEKASVTRTDADEQLNPEEQKALDWIKKHAPRLGFVPKDDLVALQDQLKTQGEALARLEGNVGQETSARREELVDQGRTQLQGLMKDVGLPATQEVQDRAETFIRNYVNADNELVRRWFGGQHKQVLAEAFSEFKALTGLTSTKSNTSYAANKNKVVNSTPRPLPRPGIASKGGTPESKQAASKRGITPATHDAAFAAAQKIWEGGSAE